jgi:hypothetical protein
VNRGGAKTILIILDVLLLGVTIGAALVGFGVFTKDTVTKTISPTATPKPRPAPIQSMFAVRLVGAMALHMMDVCAW